MLIRRHEERDVPQIKKVSRVCFSSGIWKNPRTEERMEKRWQEHSSKPGFTCLVAEEESRVVGASWFFSISPEELSQKRSKELRSFVELVNSKLSLVWIGETFVDPAFQGRGIASKLTESVMQKIEDNFAPAIALTRMRPDNALIIRINENLGFKHTDIQVPSKKTENLSHEYWYCVVEQK